MAETLKLSLLGQVAISLNETPLTQLASRKAEALLIYLVCTRQTYAREVLATMLWDDRPHNQALSNLRVLLTKLRRHVGQALIINRQSVAFDPAYPHWVDVFELETALTNLTHQQSATDILPDDIVDPASQALDLYQGAFLSGFYVRDSQAFEAWQVIEQERLHRLVVQSLQRLINHTLNIADYSTGIEHARRLLSLEPWQEETHRYLMQLLAWQGQREAALLQYETCRQVLAAELGVEPSAETAALPPRRRALIGGCLPSKKRMPSFSSVGRCSRSG